LPSKLRKIGVTMRFDMRLKPRDAFPDIDESSCRLLACWMQTFAAT
jgi:hypothetical protein